MTWAGVRQGLTGSFAHSLSLQEGFREPGWTGPAGKQTLLRPYAGQVGSAFSLDALQRRCGADTVKTPASLAMALGDHMCPTCPPCNAVEVKTLNSLKPTVSLSSFNPMSIIHVLETVTSVVLKTFQFEFIFILPLAHDQVLSTALDSTFLKAIGKHNFSPILDIFILPSPTRGSFYFTAIMTNTNITVRPPEFRSVVLAGDPWEPGPLGPLAVGAQQWGWAAGAGGVCAAAGPGFPGPADSEERSTGPRTPARPCCLEAGVAAW